MNNANPGNPQPLGDCGPGRTKQEFGDESNINNIINRYKKTGELVNVREHLAQYRDMRNIPDLGTILQIGADARSAFEELPNAVRKACGHDVANFNAFVTDPENREFCEQQGLFVPRSKTVPKPPVTLDQADPPEGTPIPETPTPPDAP